MVDLDNTPGTVWFNSTILLIYNCQSHVAVQARPSAPVASARAWLVLPSGAFELISIR